MSGSLLVPGNYSLLITPTILPKHALQVIMSSFILVAFMTSGSIINKVIKVLIKSSCTQESGSDSEGRSYFERHVFVHVVAIIYLILCALSLAPNLAVIVRLNQSMYRTIQRTLSKSSSQLSTQDTTFR